ncbi:hypothetical protein LPJ61_004009 [Coemansia biformis]|uniref:MOSC domain-containing protein n=1 Tax=Coemansia biformis TaxID=1286918 RepID=A0A9W7YA57_9FUNG|nr:hypothetical protein LPJ61_004009 [Coemansia biformis]
MGVVCGDDHDLVDGRPVGALRVSFGAMTSKQDIDALVDFLGQSFRNCGSAPSIAGPLAGGAGATAARSSSAPVRAEVDAVVIYPIKSCHGWVVPRHMPWDITPHGLKFDRSFVIMRENSTAAMQQKRYPGMALIRPRVDVARSVLVLEAPGHRPLDVSLRPHHLQLEDTESRACSTRVQAQRVRSEMISAWLSSVLSVSCYLACEPRLLMAEPAAALPPQLPGGVPCARRPTKAFSNKAQLLMVTLESAQQVERWVAEDAGLDRRADGATVGPMQYRPNLIIKSHPDESRGIGPFEELRWTSVSVGGARFDVAGPCRRCQMISVDQDSAKALKEPYSTLARRMRVGGKVVFGVYLNAAGGDGDCPASGRLSTVSAGSVVDVLV